MTLTCTVRRFRLVSHAYSRSARAPLPNLFNRLTRDGRRRSVSALPRATAQARPCPRARACSQPPTDCILLHFVGSRPPRMEAL
eukprot:2864578-Pleurochrysis_carterae.AAC.2